MIDLHCHILPLLDDGPSSISESVQMARKAASDGIIHIVATPHTNNGRFSNSPAMIQNSILAFKKELHKTGVTIEISPGAEASVTPNIIELCQTNQVSSINNSRYILVELPNALLLNSIKEFFFAMRINGYIPIIAHPERYSYFMKKPELLIDFVRMGALCQLTAQSINGFFGNVIQSVSEKMLTAGLIHIIASDAHSCDGRSPQLSQAVERAGRILGNYNVAEEMVNHIPLAIIENRSLELEQPFVKKSNINMAMQYTHSHINKFKHMLGKYGFCNPA